ncbi:MAG: ArnT family glycosyltransferase [Candidatus Paceibacterota bacterium]
MRILKHRYLILIFLIALFVRLYGINWDQGQHLHPDERFLTMVSTDARIPSSISEYLDPARSLLNPYNIGFDFYVYGTLPVTLVKSAAASMNIDNYYDITLVGRAASALADVGVVIILYKLILLWERKYRLDIRIKYLAAFLYAVTVFSIQHAHFFTVDSFLNLFVFASVYFALVFYYSKSFVPLSLSAMFFGFAIGSKLSAVFVLPVILGLVMIAFLPLMRKRNFCAIAQKLLVFFIISYVVFRFADPHAFASSNMLDPRLSSKFVAGIRQLQALSSPDVWYPPGVQWINKQIIVFPLRNIAMFGLGPVYFATVFAGIVLLLKKLNPFTRDALRNHRDLILIAAWIISFFFYQATQFGMTMRYFYFLYPVFAVLGAYALVVLWKRSRIVFGLVLVGVLLWPASFISIYSRPHSRVSASEWIYTIVPDGAVIATEHWDDGLPLSVENSEGKQFEIHQLPVFDQDTEEKWDSMNKIIGAADYYILSSNRGYGSIMSVPDRYPKMSRFYTDLFAGHTGFRLVKEFTSYPAFPPLCSALHVKCYEFPDQWAEEAFTVYDHPRVLIYKKIHL